MKSKYFCTICKQKVDVIENDEIIKYDFDDIDIEFIGKIIRCEICENEVYDKKIHKENQRFAEAQYRKYVKQVNKSED